MPQDKCEEAVDLLVSKECPSEKAVEALPAPVCDVLKNKEVVDMVCSKVPGCVAHLSGVRHWQRCL